MNETALMVSNRRPIWRKAMTTHLVSVFITTCAVAGWTTHALALAPFEKPPVLNAKVLVPAKFLKGKHHTVDQKVPINGFLGQFTLRTQYGNLEVRGRELLQTRVGEIRAIQALDEKSKEKTFATAAKDAALRPIQAVKQVVENPEETLKGIPSGIERFFHSAYRQVKKTTIDVADTVADYVEEKPKDADGEKTETAPDQHPSDEPAMPEKVVSKAGDVAKNYFGYNKARRQLAKQLKIDPYTTNPILKQKLDEVAWAAFAGGMAFKLAVPIPDAISYTTKVSDLVWDLPPADLEEVNEKKLQAMGISGRSVRELFRNKWFSPTLTTALVMALDRLSGTDGREDVIGLAETVTSEEEARYLTGATQLLAYYHKAVTPVKEVKILGTVVGRTRNGDVIVPMQVDYIAWTQRIAEFAQRPDLQAGNRSLWISGKFSPLAKQELTALGWTTKEEVHVPTK